MEEFSSLTNSGGDRWDGNQHPVPASTETHCDGELPLEEYCGAKAPSAETAKKRGLEVLQPLGLDESWVLEAGLETLDHVVVGLDQILDLGQG
ncbi:MAG: hypothetical protein KME47_19280 [Nodosilinea sp. WJT8-NPBG4]|nr:hypothetical protein [Nodosilinea sp. WJT8-NPBG4]